MGRWGIVVLGCAFGCSSPDSSDRDGAPSSDASRAVDAGRDAQPAQLVTDSDYIADPDPDLLNPERGMYYWSVQGDDPHTLVAEWLYLGTVCAQDLAWEGHGDPATSTVLDAYATELVAHRDAGRKVVFRPRYDTAADNGLNACGVFHADTWARQLAHVDAIASMLGDFEEVIGFVEAGYLGRWGEWNTSGFEPSDAPFLTDPVSRRALMSHVLSAYASAGIDHHVELRRPIFAKELIDADAEANVGLYNDCFMTSDSDYGTYSNYESDNPSNFPSSEEAKTWAEGHTAAAPFGGETCPYTGARWESCANMVGATSEPAALHMSYLHGAWAPDAVDTWEAGDCYDDIKRSLGYRFVVEQVEYPPAVAADEALVVRVTVRNTGWSRMHRPRTASVVLRDGDTAYELATTASAVRDWIPGEAAILEATGPLPAPGTYELRLHIPDPGAPEIVPYAVRLASTRAGEPLFDETTGENVLGVQLSIAGP
jgi:hypothetical protein